MRAAVYARFSSNNQREESITAQLRAAHEYAKRKGYTIVKEYADEAISGRTDDRASFQQMMEDSKKDLFDILILHKVDRFARNRYDSVVYKHILRKKLKIKIEYVGLQLDDSPESKFMEGVFESYAEFYSENLALEVKKGQKESALQGKHLGGIPAIGYRVNEEQKYEIVEHEAEAVRYIFQAVLQKHSYREICDVLNHKGYRTKRGTPFRSNSIFDILRNPKYCGKYVFGRIQAPKTEKRNCHAYQEPIVELEGAIPAIVTVQEWEEVQDMLSKRKTPRNIKGKTEYLLTGYVFCGECGAVYCGTRQKNRHNGGYYYYYRCNRSNNGFEKSCGNSQIRCDMLEENLLNELWLLLDQPEHKKLFTEKIIDKVNKATNEIEPDIAKMEKQYTALIKKRDAYTEAIGKGALYLAKEAQETHNQAEAISTAITLRKAQKGELKPAIVQNKTDEIFVDIKKSPDINRALVAQLLDHITISKEEITIYLKLPKALCVKMVTPEGFEPPTF